MKRIALLVSPLAVVALAYAFVPDSVPVVSPREVQETADPDGASPLVGERVGVEGVVTATAPNGRYWYLSDPAGGAWSGLRVEGDALARTVGERVFVGGVVEEHLGETVLRERGVRVRGAAALPEPAIVTVLDLLTNGEPWEGVLVRLLDVQVEDETSRYGETPLSDPTGAGAVLDDEFFHSYIADIGDRFDSVTGVISYGFGNYRLEARGDDDLVGWQSIREFDGLARVSVMDEQGRPLPSRIVFLPVGGEDLEIGPDDRWSASWDTAYLALGEGEVRIPSGEYDVVVSRGPEYGVHEERVLVPSGGAVDIATVLPLVLDTRGWISGDFHLHATPSFDTPLPVPGRIVSLAGEGVEWAIATDHNEVTDYGPVIEQLGLAGWITSSIGAEVTTRSPSFGHFNTWPVPAGSPPVPYEGFDPAGLFAAARVAGPEIIQVNHPATDPASSNYFDLFRVSRYTGEPEEPGFSWGFDAIEVFNGGWIDQGFVNLETWMRMLNAGRRITATGNSDSHHIVFREPGYPRNLIRVPDDSPATAREEDLVRAVLDGAVVVSYGPVLDFQVNGVLLGEGLAPVGTEGVHMRVRVQAPAWARPTEGRLYANGVVVRTFPLAIDSEDPLDLTLHAQHRPERDTWYVFLVEGDGDLEPVRRGEWFHPVAFTNPIRVDVDGNGVFDPPGNIADATTIAQLDAVDPAGVPLRLGDWVTVEGCATTDVGWIDPAAGIFALDDGTGGLQVREEPGAVSAVVRGDRVRVSGFVTQVLGETILGQAVVEVRPEPVVCAAAIDRTTGAIAGGVGVEPLEGRVVRVTGASVIGGGWPSGEGAVTVDDGTGPVTLVVPAGVVVADDAPTSGLTLTAIVSQRDFTEPYDSGYRLVLRDGSDLSTGAAGGADPSARDLRFGVPRTNPFGSRLVIPYSPAASSPRATVHDVGGRAVRRLQGRAGQIIWDGRDDAGSGVAPGVYWVRTAGAPPVRVVKVQ